MHANCSKKNKAIVLKSFNSFFFSILDLSFLELWLIFLWNLLFFKKNVNSIKKVVNSIKFQAKLTLHI